MANSQLPSHEGISVITVMRESRCQSPNPDADLNGSRRGAAPAAQPKRQYRPAIAPSNATIPSLCSPSPASPCPSLRPLVLLPPKHLTAGGLLPLRATKQHRLQASQPQLLSLPWARRSRAARSTQSDGAHVSQTRDLACGGGGMLQE